jgi:hypothetical protein
VAQKGSNRKLVMDFLYDNPNITWSDLQLAEATGLTNLQVYDALFQVVKNPTNNIEKVGQKSWRHIPPAQKRQLLLTIVKETGKDTYEAVDQYGASYSVKAL